MTNWIGKFITKFKMHVDPNMVDAKKIIDDQIEIFIPEEVQELLDAWRRGDAEEVVDALGDISWHCEKTMQQLKIDIKQVRDEIGRANLSKELGVKPGREKAKIDVIKPSGWIGPNHENNHGILDDLFS